MLAVKMSADLYFGDLPFKEDAATIKDASSVDPTDSIVIKLASFQHGKLGTLYPPPYSHVLACPVLPFLLSIPIIFPYTHSPKYQFLN